MSLMSFADAEAKRASPAVINDEIRKSLRAIWPELEGYFLPPGKCGSKAYDQAIIVDRILAWDEASNEGRIKSFELSYRLLWNHVYAVIGKVFQTSHGRVVGLLEDDSASTPKARSESTADVE